LRVRRELAPLREEKREGGNVKCANEPDEARQLEAIRKALEGKRTYLNSATKQRRPQLRTRRRAQSPL